MLEQHRHTSPLAPVKNVPVGHGNLVNKVARARLVWQVAICPMVFPFLII
jgi:hypothetical protein